MTQATRTLAQYKRPLRYVMGVFYVVAGALHVVAPAVYEQVVPPEFPRPRELVYLSGVAEIVLGVGVLIPRFRRRSAWGLVGLLLAVFPANVHVAIRDVELDGVPDWASDPPDAAAWARLPLQAVLVLWAWWYTRPTPDGRD